MGIYVHLNVADTTTQAEWEPAYKESLRLIARFPIMDICRKTVHGAELFYAVHAKEHLENGKQVWCACGDLETMQTAEENRLWRVLPKPEQEPPVDVLFSCFWDMKLDGIPDRYIYNRHWRYWNGKTQGQPVHMYLLAVACLLEDLLPGKVLCAGDITVGQCRRAVRMASEALGREIRMPVRCDPERLYARVRAMPLAACDVVRCFCRLYLGSEDEAFGQFLRDHFSREELHSWWVQTFQDDGFRTIGYQTDLKRYLTMGFGIPELRQYLPLIRHDEADLQEVFRDVLDRILDAELHIPEKDCEDLIGINEEAEIPYGIETLMVLYGLGAARNQRVDRYIPLPELRTQLEECVGEYCDVPVRIAEWTAEREKRESGEMEEIRQTLRTARDRQESLRTEYDAADLVDLLHFQPGWTIAPNLEKALAGPIRIYRDCADLEDFQMVQNLPAEALFRCLAAVSFVLTLTLEDWERIWDRLHTDKRASARYLLMGLVEINTADMQMLMRALICNDALYEHCMQHLQEDPGEAEV